QILGKGVHGFHGVVAVDAALGGSRPQQPIAVEELLISEERSDIPPVDILEAILEILLDLLLAVFHAEADLEFVRQRKILEIKGLAGTDTNAGELGADFLFLRRSWCELQGEVEILKEVLLDQLLVDPGEVYGDRGDGRC